MFPKIDVKPVPGVHIVESGAKCRGAIFYEAISPPFIITPRLSEIIDVNTLFDTGSPTSAESVMSGYSGCASERISPGPAPGSPVASVKFGPRATRTSRFYGSLKKVN